MRDAGFETAEHEANFFGDGRKVGSVAFERPGERHWLYLAIGSNADGRCAFFDVVTKDKEIGVLTADGDVVVVRTGDVRVEADDVSVLADASFSEEGADAVREADPGEGGSFGRMTPAVALSAVVDLTEDPASGSFVEKEAKEIDGVRAIDEEAGARMAVGVDSGDDAELAAGDDTAGSDVLGAETALMPNNKKSVGLSAGGDHGISIGKGEGDGFFAEDGPGAGLGGGNGQGCMERMRSADGEDIGSVSLQELFEGRVSAGNGEFGGETLASFKERIGTGDERDIGLGEVTTSVSVSHAPTTDDGSTVIRHG